MKYEIWIESDTREWKRLVMLNEISAEMLTTIAQALMRDDVIAVRVLKATLR